MIFGVEITPTLCYLAVGLILAGLLSFLFLLEIYVYLTTGVCKSTKKMNGKTVLITGCTSGIGKETARDMVKRGARVIMACRNVEAATKLKGKFFFHFSNLIHFMKSKIQNLVN